MGKIIGNFGDALLAVINALWEILLWFLFETNIWMKLFIIAMIAYFYMKKCNKRGY